jgi:hypothetical protein
LHEIDGVASRLGLCAVIRSCANPSPGRLPA